MVRLWACGAMALVASMAAPPVAAQTPAAPFVATVGAPFRDCPDCPELTVIPAGRFLMGTKLDPFSYFLPPRDEQPQHPVTVAAFVLATHEVTQAEWFAVMGDNPSAYKGRNLPVERVSWDETQLFIQKLNAVTGKVYRLPTEAEWEYAARAGTTTLYSFGDDAARTGTYAWHFDIADFRTHPVGEKLPNAFGLYDMYGNVWEWVQDCYTASYVGAPTDAGTAVTEEICFHVLRGGSWLNDPGNQRSATRNRATADYRNDTMGFRVARTLP